MWGGRQLVIQCRGEACLDAPADGILVVKIDAGADGTEKKAPLCRGAVTPFGVTEGVNAIDMAKAIVR